MKPAPSWPGAFGVVLESIGVAVLLADLLAICLLRYEFAAAMRPLTIGAAVVCGVALVQAVASGPSGWRWWFTPAALWHWVPFVAYAAACTASARLAPAGSLYPHIVAEAWWFAGLAIASAQIARNVRGRRLTLAVLIAALAVLMLGVLGPKSAADLSGRFLRYSAIVQWGAYPEIGLLGLLGASAALAIALTAATWALRAAAAILAVIFGIVPFAVNSRGAVVALIATGGWLAACVVLRGRRRLVMPLAAAACLVAIAGAFGYRAQIGRLAQSSGDVQATAAVSSRTEDWRVAVRMVAAHPLLGVGPGRYPLEFARYSSAPPQNHAHNMLLHVGAEAGLLGLIPFAVVWGRLLWLTLRAAASGAGAQRREAFVLHALIAAFFIRAMTDQFLSSVHSSFRTTLLMAIVLGLAEAAARGSRQAETARGPR